MIGHAEPHSVTAKQKDPRSRIAKTGPNACHLLGSLVLNRALQRRMQRLCGIVRKAQHFHSNHYLQKCRP